jgi:hypothetical protein
VQAVKREQSPVQTVPTLCLEQLLLLVVALVRLMAVHHRMEALEAVANPPLVVGELAVPVQVRQTKALLVEMAPQTIITRQAVAAALVQLVKPAVQHLIALMVVQAFLPTLLAPQ